MGPQSVLIVEDDRATRSALARDFVRRGWDVAQAMSVADALEVLGRGVEPSMVILDLMLPDGGEAVLRRARASREGSFIVMSSGCDDDRRLEAVARLGPHRIVPKPCGLSALRDACHDAMTD